MIVENVFNRSPDKREYLFLWVFSIDILNISIKIEARGKTTEILDFSIVNMSTGLSPVFIVNECSMSLQNE